MDQPTQNGHGRHKSSRSPPIGDRETPFGSYPPAGGSTMNETLTTYLKQRDEDPSHSRSHKKRSRSHSSSTVSNLLLAATERLGQETNRANELEARCGEVLSRLRTVVDERQQLRRDLAKVSEELRLYKMQLDFAQKEINRAQAIVEGVDKARQEAEEQAAKDRTIARRLASERAVWIAREEGRNEGYKEGLKQGRRWANEMAQRRAESEQLEYEWEGDEDEEQELQEPEDYSPSTAESSSPSSHQCLRPLCIPRLFPVVQHWIGHPLSPPLIRLVVPRVRRPNRKLKHNGLAPAHGTPAIPLPARQPKHTYNLSPVALVHLIHHQETETKMIHRPTAQPMDVAPDTRISTGDGSRSRPPSFARSRRSSIVLPDGYIPTVGLGPDSIISLPAPHSLSRPVSLVAGDDDSNELDTATSGFGFDDARTQQYGGRATSRASTRMSDFDLLQPPPRQTDTPITQRIVREWRAANANGPEQRQAPNSKGKSKERGHADTFSMRSSTTTPSQVPSRRSHGAAPAPGPRRPRDIVLPMPLSTTMFSAGVVNNPNTARASTGTRQGPAPAPGPHAQPLTSAYGYTTTPAPTRPSTAGPAYGNVGAASAMANTPGSYVPMTLPDGQVPVDSTQQQQQGRPKSAMAWIKRRLSRSFSSTSVPNIQVEPPSNSASGPSTGLITDAALLAADHDAAAAATQVDTQPDPFILPELTNVFADAFAAARLQAGAGPSDTKTKSSNHLPPGFVPATNNALSPILLPLRSDLPNASPGQPPAYSTLLQADGAYTPPPGSSMHSEMGSAPASVATQSRVSLPGRV
ncbi:hypothetical protein C8F01DRAFT_1252390 [Mycena amicta]|nr:hypothetical protein C8F01DRAFT_1252390 [Mycena amicta]